MTDREKVIEALEMSYKYSNVDENNTLVPQCVVLHALALLKTQEPRLVTEADFENADPYGYLPVWVEDKDNGEIICDCITKHAIMEPDEDCHYRYWTSRPTEEQIKAEEWE